MKIIDPHLHLFELSQGKYAWLQPENAPFWPDKKLIHRDFFESDLQLDAPLTLAGFVHIEAGFNNQQPWQEIRWLEQSCKLPFRSIAGINLFLAGEAFLSAIIQLKQYPSVVGVREILDEQAVEYLSKPLVHQNLTQLAQHHLIFELQMPLSNLLAVELLVNILSEVPDLKVIINHAGWPPYPSTHSDSKDHHADGQLFKDWQQGLALLSQHQQCEIKCSGFEMADRCYSEQWFEDIITSCINYFGINRVMLASNFPLCLFNSSYAQNWQKHQQSSIFTTAELNKLNYLNAKRLYNF